MPKPKTYETWPIGRLTWLDRQDQNFLPLSDAELKPVSEAVRRGEYDPIEVTRDRRIIDGHQRYRCAQRWARKEVRVCVRHDLGDDEFAIELRHIEANASRRQLHSLDRARCARRMLELKYKRQPGGLTDFEVGGLCEEISKVVGKSKRHAQRLLNALNAPIEVQAAHIAGEVKLIDVEAIARLDSDVRERIAEKIRGGGDPKALVNRYLPRKKRIAKNVGKELDRIVEAAERGREVLDGRLDEIHRTGEQCGRDLKALRWLRDFTKEMVPKLRARKAEAERSARALEALQELSARSRHGRRA